MPDANAAAPAPVGGLSPGMVLDGRFEVGSLLARGAMGAVHRGTDRSSGNPVVLKTLVQPASDKARQRFAREARVLGKLAHPNVVTVLAASADEHADPPWVAMEAVPGESLADLAFAGAGWAPQRVAPLAEQLFAALDAVHRAGVIHRDVKPANIIVATDTAADASTPERLVLVDFGVAQADDHAPGLTKTGLAIGTPAWMAPEVLQGTPASPASDVWAASAVVFRLLTGLHPREVSQSAWPRVLASLGPWADVIGRGLGPVEQRPADGATVLQMLANGASPNPVVVPALSPVATPPPAATRRWPMVAVLTTFAAAGVLGWVLVTGTGGPHPQRPNLRGEMMRPLVQLPAPPRLQALEPPKPPPPPTAKPAPAAETPPKPTAAKPRKRRAAAKRPVVAPKTTPLPTKPLSSGYSYERLDD